MMSSLRIGSMRTRISRLSSRRTSVSTSGSAQFRWRRTELVTLVYDWQYIKTYFQRYFESYNIFTVDKSTSAVRLYKILSTILILELQPQLKRKIIPTEITFSWGKVRQNPLREKMNYRWKAQICKEFVQLPIANKLCRFEITFRIRYKEYRQGAVE